METFTIFSNHLILPDHPYPLPGLIEVTGEYITNLTLLPPSTPIPPIPNLINLSNYFISPGLIDLNTRLEWEDLKTFTQSAISGGVTFTLIEESYYNNICSDSNELFCDIGFTKIVNDESVSLDLSQFFALKMYLCEPSAEVRPMRDLSLIHRFEEKFEGCLFVDPSLPDKRMLHINSPHRFEGVSEHVNSVSAIKSNIFAGAYSQNAVDSDDSESEDTVPKRTTSLMEQFLSLFPGEPILPVTLSKGGDEIISIPEQSEPEELSPRRPPHRAIHITTHSSTLFDSIDKKITENTQSFSTLCLAETHSYKFSSKTSLTSSPSDLSPEVTSPLFPRKRPSKIETIFSEHDLRQDYCSYLANCPEQWETNGIDFLLNFLSVHSKIHIQGISSAAAINKIRRAGEQYKELTCELPASHLFFTSSAVKNKETLFKTHPPIRDQVNYDLTWELLKLNAVQAISSVHVCIDEQYKALDSGNFHNALSGICCLGSSLQAVWTAECLAVGEQRAVGTLGRIFKWMALKPAKILGIGRGVIKIGFLADLVVWDPFEKIMTKRGEKWEKIAVFEGKELYGKVEKVFVRGKIAFEGGKFFAVGERRRRC